MTPERRDPELRAAYDALRRSVTEEGRVPDFEGMMAGARERTERDSRDPTLAPRRRTALRWAPLAAAAAVAGLLLLGRPGPDPDAEFERRVADYRSLGAAGAWRSPTAALLDIPGVDLGAVPSFGRSLPGRGLPLDAPPEGRTP